MSTLRDMAVGLTQADAQRYTRIQELEMALVRMICAHENTLEDSEGRYPRPDSHCIYCTKGTVPDQLNTGLCAYHDSKRLLGQRL